MEEGDAETDLARRGIGAFGTIGEDVDELDCFGDDMDEPARVDAKEGEALLIL